MLPQRTAPASPVPLEEIMTTESDAAAESTEETVPGTAEETAEETTEEGAASSAMRPPRMGMQALLTRDTDMAARPGFRSPSNKRSKVQSGAKKNRRVQPKRKKNKKKR